MRHRIGSLHRQTEHWNEAKDDFRQAVALQKPLVDRFPGTPAYALWLATFRIALADALIHQGESAQARQELEPTIAALTAAWKSNPDPRPVHELLASAYSRLEVALRQVGEPSQAAEAGRKAEQERQQP